MTLLQFALFAFVVAWAVVTWAAGGLRPFVWGFAWPLAKVLWCLAIGTAPWVLTRLNDRYLQALGCPSEGDCYLPGTEVSFDMELLCAATAVLLWPVCLWVLVQTTRDVVWHWRSRRARSTKASV